MLECALVTDNDYFGEPQQRATIVNVVQMLEEALEAGYLVGFREKDTKYATSLMS